MMQENPLEALKLRFVKGEITNEQYREMLSALLPPVAASSENIANASTASVQSASPLPANMNDPLEVVKLRYARGDISKDEYDRMVATLGIQEQSVRPHSPVSSPPRNEGFSQHSHTMYHPNYGYQSNWFLNLMLPGYFIVGGIATLLYGFWGAAFIVLVLAVAVYKDAQDIGAGIHVNDNTRPGEWALGVFLLWILAYPYYLYKRKTIFELNQLPLANMNKFESQYATDIRNEYLGMLGREPTSSEMKKGKRGLASGQSIEQVRETLLNGK